MHICCCSSNASLFKSLLVWRESKRKEAAASYWATHQTKRTPSREAVCLCIWLLLYSGASLCGGITDWGGSLESVIPFRESRHPWERSEVSPFNGASSNENGSFPHVLWSDARLRHQQVGFDDHLRSPKGQRSEPLWNHPHLEVIFGTFWTFPEDFIKCVHSFWSYFVEEKEPPDVTSCLKQQLEPSVSAALFKDDRQFIKLPIIPK